MLFLQGTRDEFAQLDAVVDDAQRHRAGEDDLAFVNVEGMLTPPSLYAIEPGNAPDLVGRAGLTAHRDRDSGQHAQRDALTEALARSAKVLAGSDVRLAVEPLNTLVDHPGYFLPTVAGPLLAATGCATLNPPGAPGTSRSRSPRRSRTRSPRTVPVSSPI